MLPRDRPLIVSEAQDRFVVDLSRQALGCIVATGRERLGLTDLPPVGARHELAQTLGAYLSAVVVHGMPKAARLHNEARVSEPVKEAAREAANCVLYLVHENFKAFSSEINFDQMDEYLHTVLVEFYTNWASPRHNPKSGKQGSLFTSEDEGFALTSPEGQSERVVIPQGSQPSLFDMGKPDRKAMEEMRRRELAARAARKRRRSKKKSKNPRALPPLIDVIDVQMVNDGVPVTGPDHMAQSQDWSEWAWTTDTKPMYMLWVRADKDGSIEAQIVGPLEEDGPDDQFDQAPVLQMQLPSYFRPAQHATAISHGMRQVLAQSSGGSGKAGRTRVFGVFGKQPNPAQLKRRLLK